MPRAVVLAVLGEVGHAVQHQLQLDAALLRLLQQPVPVDEHPHVLHELEPARAREQQGAEDEHADGRRQDVDLDAEGELAAGRTWFAELENVIDCTNSVSMNGR